jgi:hypothetical protein
MKLMRFLFILIAFSIIQVYPQDINSYVVSIPLGNDYHNNQIEKLRLPVVFINDNELVLVITSENIDILESGKIDYSVIDDFDPADKLSLISSIINSNVALKLSGEKILYDNQNTVLVKNLSISNKDIVELGLELNEIELSNTFKNIRHVQHQDITAISDSFITQITSSVNPDSVRYFIQSLQNFQTRFLFANTRDAVADWILNQFLQMGFTDVVLDSFEYQGTWQKNVVATLPGVFEPDVYNIVGGHHDSYSSGDPMIFAPGADDNASGTAAVLEIARVIKANNYQPESTIKFVTFAAEEYGLWGSKDYAEKALLSGMNIKIMINHDMISHTYYPAQQSEVDINWYSGFEYLSDLAFYCVENYSVLTPSTGSPNSSGSDSHSFWQRGFPSVYFEESNFSPFYHSPADTIGNYNMEYCAEVIKASCATLLMNIVIPTMVQNYNLVDAGTGNSLLLTWSPNTSSDLSYYKIYIGIHSGVYDTVLTTLDTIFTVGGLTEGNPYYVGISVIDTDGYESMIVEKSAIPFEFPSSPQSFTATPLWHKVRLFWNRNNDYDFYGYNLYRADIEGQLGVKLNQNILFDSLYIDETASNGIYYYYTVKAVDSLLNESINNTTLRSRVVSLDQGILVVDETADGDGSIMNPTDSEVDNYYNDILIPFTTQNYDIIQESQISLADLGAFSTIIWHGNDITDMNAPFDYKNEIKKYLDFGGNFFYAGYRPSKAFENVASLTGTFSSGDFIFDYLKIQETKGTVSTLFNEAKSIALGYSNIFVDSLKTLSSSQYHLKYIEMVKASNEGINIYSYETNFDSTSQQGFLKGKPVGVEYIGNDFKSITLSFPLYYMNKNQAKSFIEFILTNKFEEVMAVDEPIAELPSSYNLLQNYPNPFNPTTTIRYALPEDGFVKLAVYNMLGEEVAEIVNTQQKAGKYEVSFSAGNLSSGVYVYRLETSKYISSKKLILLR